jgi:hypothetical protein
LRAGDGTNGFKAGRISFSEAKKSRFLWTGVSGMAALCMVASPIQIKRIGFRNWSERNGAIGETRVGYALEDGASSGYGIMISTTKVVSSAGLCGLSQEVWRSTLQFSTDRLFVNAGRRQAGGRGKR